MWDAWISARYTINSFGPIAGHVFIFFTHLLHMLTKSNIAIERHGGSAESCMPHLHNHNLWGGRNTWHIKFEPAKSQALTISHHRSPNEVPAINFQGTVVPEVAELRLLGIMFDKDLSFRTHIRQLNIRGTQRGFLRKGAAVLGPAGCVTAYKGFVQPVLEYGMLTWMEASQTALRQLANVQRRALHVIGPGSFLPSLEVRRAVAALCFLYKLHYLPGSAILTRLLPPPAPPPQRETRMQLAVHHNCQLTLIISWHSYPWWQNSIIANSKKLNTIYRNLTQLIA